MPSLASVVKAALIAITLVSAAPSADLFNRRARTVQSFGSEFPDGLRARAAQTAINGLPGCEGEDQDPTWTSGSSRWRDGEGKYVTSSCDNGLIGKWHCWTEYFVVGTTNSYNNWYQAMGAMECSVGDSCSESMSHMTQTCTNFQWSVTDTVGLTFTAMLIPFTESLTAGISAGYTSCNGNTTSASCSWADGGCHTIWASQQITSVVGYMRRTCGSPTEDKRANMPNTIRRPDGYYTRGMTDFSIPLAGISAIDCNGSCIASWSPTPLVSNLTTVTPWPQ